MYHLSISNGHLTASVYHYFGASLASNTHRAYGVGQNHFIIFCLLQGIIRPSSPLLPASEITLIYFAAHLVKTICYSTIKLYLFAVQDLHRQHNFPLKLSKIYRLQKVLTGIKWTQKPPKLNPHPITIQISESIYNYFKPPQSYNVDHIMLWAAFTLAFFGFLRASEFTCNSSSFDPTVHLCLRDVTFIPNIESPNHMLVSIKKSKTDPFRQGCTLTIARSLTSICSVMAMRDYLLQCKPAATGPLFIFTNCKWLSRTSLTKELRSALQGCGLPADQYFTHSFQIGAATTAAAAGEPSWLIKVLGRCSSDCYERYIRTPQKTLLDIPKKLVMDNCNQSDIWIISYILYAR